MAVLKRGFYYHEKGNHDEDWFYLARDTDSGRVFIIHEWAHRENLGDRELSLEEFLTSRGRGTRQDNLIKLIGTLVADTAEA